MRILVLAITFVLSFSAFAERVDSVGTIKRLYTYSEQDGFDGDVAIIVSNPVAGCEGGFWLRKSAAEGYKTTLSFLLSAFHADTTVQFGALNNELWPGSGAKFCRLDQVSLLK